MSIFTNLQKRVDNEADLWYTMQVAARGRGKNNAGEAKKSNQASAPQY